MQTDPDCPYTLLKTTKSSGCFSEAIAVRPVVAAPPMMTTEIKHWEGEGAQSTYGTQDLEQISPHVQIKTDVYVLTSACYREDLDPKAQRDMFS